MKVYPSGGVAETRRITKPVAGTVAVQIAGIPQTSRWTVDTTTGIVTFAANPTAAVTGVTNSNPCRITTATSHGLQTGDSVHLSGLQGIGQLNGLRFILTRINWNSFSLNGVDATGLGGWSGGGVTNTLPQASEAVTASFEFDVPVRFDSDTMAVSIETYEMQAWGQIPIIELRV